MKTNEKFFKRSMIRIFSLSLLVLFFAQCEGPMGPQGYDGNDGADGTAYAYSAIYDVAAASWSGDVDGYSAYLSVPEITQDIYYDGAVLVYRLIEVEPVSFNMLPYTYVDGVLAIYLDYDAYIGGINLLYKEVYDGVNDTPAPTEVLSFKVLVVEGIPLAQLKGMVDVEDYDAVTDLLGRTAILYE